MLVERADDRVTRWTSTRSVTLYSRLSKKRFRRSSFVGSRDIARSVLTLCVVSNGVLSGSINWIGRGVCWLIIAFLGMLAWAWSGKRKQVFHDASMLPLEEDNGQIPQDSGERSNSKKDRIEE